MRKSFRELVEGLALKKPRTNLSNREKARVGELHGQIVGRMSSLQDKLARLRGVGDGVQRTQQFIGGLKKPTPTNKPRIPQIQGRGILGRPTQPTVDRDKELRDIRLAELLAHHGKPKPKPVSPQINRRQQAPKQPIVQPQQPATLQQRGIQVAVGQRRRKADENIQPSTQYWDEVENEIVGPSNNFKVGGGSFISKPPPPEVLASYPDPNTITPEDFAGMHKQEGNDDDGLE